MKIGGKRPESSVYNIWICTKKKCTQEMISIAYMGHFWEIEQKLYNTGEQTLKKEITRQTCFIF